MCRAESLLTQTGTYVIDPEHSRIGFAARHAMVATVRGSFNVFEGAGYFDIERPESSYVELTIDASSVDTRHAERDTHLRSAEFLDVASHPTITFIAVSIDQIGVRTYRVAGDLTIKGVTKPVVLEVERTGWMVDGDGYRRIGFEGRGVINRRDWGIAGNELLDVPTATVTNPNPTATRVGAMAT